MNENLSAPSGPISLLDLRTGAAARLEMAPLRVVQWDTLLVDRFARAQNRTNWSVFPNGKAFLMIGGRKSTGSPKAVVNWPQLPAMQRAGGTPQ